MGNPLALKMAATSIQDLFAGDVVQFLQQGTVSFNSISNLLQQQCDGQDHQVRLWDSNTGQCLKLLEGQMGIVTSVRFSLEGQYLASTSSDQTVRLWNVATGQCRQILHGHAACVWSAVFHPDDQTLFTAGEDNVIRCWNVATGQCVQTLIGHQHWVRAIADAQMENT